MSKEADLQKQIVEILQRNRAFVFSIPNERKDVTVLGKLKALGMVPGISDLGIVVDGKIHFLEVKAADGVQSASQRDFQARCVMLNIPYKVVFSLTEALKVLSEWRAIKVAKVAA